MIDIIDDKEAANLMRQDESRLIMGMLRLFSTIEPFQQALRKQINLIGRFLLTWTKANKSFNFFSNPDIETIHYMFIDEQDLAPIFHEQKELEIRLDNNAAIGEVFDGNIKKLCDQIMQEAGYRYLFVPFFQHGPFGNFVLAFKERIPDKALCDTIIGTLNVLQQHLKALLYNHYPITRFTYLPSFLSAEDKEVAILVCDVRNSTQMFEVARMAEDKDYTEMIVTFLRFFLEYASRIISVPNIGRIHRATGDGFIATFGEHFTIESPYREQAACALVFLIAKLLVDGFNELWIEFLNHNLYHKFLRTYNEDLELRLGIGLNYGQVRFDFFGTTQENQQNGTSTRGFCEYMAVGDHMNFAARLCSVANQQLSSVINVYRSDGLRKSRLIAPIIASKTITYINQEAFRDSDPLQKYRSDFMHKGRNHSMPSFEIFPDETNDAELKNRIKDIHQNHFYNSIDKEISPLIKNRPELKQVVKQLVNNLNEIYYRKRSIN